jgi:hypothetical protein
MGQVNRIGSTPDSASSTAATATSLLQPGGYSLLVNSLYRTAFGRLADPEGLVNRVHQLQSGVFPVSSAEELVASAEFQARYGSGREIDGAFLTALYWDGLGRPPDPEGFAYWLAQGEKGATRAKILAGFCQSAEALGRVLLPPCLPPAVKESPASAPARVNLLSNPRAGFRNKSRNVRILCHFNHYFGPSLDFVGKSTTGASEHRLEVVHAAISSIRALPFDVDIRVCGFKDYSLLPVDIDLSSTGNPLHIDYTSIERMFEATITPSSTWMTTF